MSELSLMSDLRELIKWVYKLGFPTDEQYNLQSQIRRAVVSVSLNVREGNVFKGKKKKQFFTIALGSLQEVDECMILYSTLDFPSFSGAYSLDKRKEEFKEFRDNHYWKCLNKLKKLIQSINSTNKK